MTNKTSFDVDLRVKNFNFYTYDGKRKIKDDYYFLRGSSKKIPFKLLNYYFHVDIKKESFISKTERRIEFRFNIEMKPDIGELHFDGDCILESPEQQKVSFFIQNFPPFKEFIVKQIIKNCYFQLEKIAKKENFPILPPPLFFKKHGIM